MRNVCCPKCNVRLFGGVSLYEQSMTRYYPVIIDDRDHGGASFGYVHMPMGDPLDVHSFRHVGKVRFCPMCGCSLEWNDDIGFVKKGE